MRGSSTLLSLGYRVTRSSAQSRTRRVTTMKYAFAISRHGLPEFCIFAGALQSEGARKTGGALHPRSRAQSAHLEKTHTSIQVQRKHSGLPCAREAIGAKSAIKSKRLPVCIHICVAIRRNGADFCIPSFFEH